MMQGSLALVRNDAGPTVLLPEERRWKAREVRYYGGSWAQLSTLLPRFEAGAFKADGSDLPNPYYQSIVRQPLTKAERAIPVGIVSNTYHLIQHADVGDLCIRTLEEHGFDAEDLQCQIGLTELAEWMNLRIILPANFGYRAPDGLPLELRLEVFNSVDGSCKLKMCMSWFRQICSNGMVVRDSETEIASRHDYRLELDDFRKAIRDGIRAAKADQTLLDGWNRHSVSARRLTSWIDGKLKDAWGAKAATRAYHICMAGEDVEMVDPFEGGNPSDRTVRFVEQVPGARVPAATLYDVAQTLSWLASQRKAADERMTWLAAIPRLIRSLSKA